jgi:copper chaperone CopZ
MESLNLELPALFADHHVIEVRRILAELPGVRDVYASSAFRMIEVEYDPDQTPADEIQRVLRDAGYFEAPATPVEFGAEQNGEGPRPFFRHSTAYAQAGQTVSFAQTVQFDGRPLWPCPGLGLVEKKEAEHGA